MHKQINIIPWPNPKNRGTIKQDNLEVNEKREKNKQK